MIFCKKTIPLALSLILMTGCAAISKKMAEMNKNRFKVDLSPLDYVQFSRTIQREGEVPISVNLELDGSGYLELRTGRSKRVRNDFWQKKGDGNWHDFKSDRIILSREETEAYYQRLVDAGVFDNVKQNKEIKTKATLIILAKMTFEKKLVFTNDPALIKIFNELLNKF